MSTRRIGLSVRVSVHFVELIGRDALRIRRVPWNSSHQTDVHCRVIVLV